VSNPSLTPVATGTTSVFLSDPVVRFQRAIELELQVRDLERRVQRLERRLAPVTPSPSGPHRRDRAANGWPTA
jgi:hypothetical protein